MRGLEGNALKEKILKHIFYISSQYDLIITIKEAVASLKIELQIIGQVVFGDQQVQRQLQKSLHIIISMGCGAVNPQHIDNGSHETVLTLNRIYERKELIGSGTYGKVYRCINKLNGQQYALKIVEITAKTREEALKQINNLKAQIGVLKKVNHQNIVKYYSFDISNDNKEVQIVLEYAKKGSLKQYIQQRGYLKENQASEMAAQILKGLKHLHDQNIVHRDLKCANILMMEDGTVKISDFGTAKSIKITSNEDIAKICSSLKGTPYYMAPQVLRRTGHGISADIWSLGCLVIEMISGRAPWTSLTNNFKEIISYIVTGIHPPFPKALSSECECFLESCLDNVPSQRLNAQQLLKHRWIDHTSVDKLKNLDQKSSKGISTLTKDCEILEQLEQRDNRAIKKQLKQKKHKQIERYIVERSNDSNSKRKPSSKSGKAKKDRSISIKHQDTIDVEEEIQITPHYQNLAERISNPQMLKSKDASLKKDEMMKITKTAPQMKIPEDIIHQIKQIEEQSFQYPLTQKNAGVEDFDQHYFKTESSKQEAINTLISRQERLKYLEIQKKARQQREEEKKRWEQQLKQGANYLRKQITNRYNV